MIKKLNINFVNCYGIRKFAHEFSFEKGHVHLLYAPNGTMKTSFAKTMKYLSGQEKNEPCDLLHRENKSNSILQADGNEIPKENIFVFNGDDELNSSNAFVNFLASHELKVQYDGIYQKLATDKDALITKLKDISKSSNCEEELLQTFSSKDHNSIFSILENIYGNVKNNTIEYNFRYNDVFDKKGAVKTFLDTHKSHLQEYIKNYERLVRESKLYRSVDKFTFGTYQASQLLQYVSDGIFFGVNHKIILQDGEEITSRQQLQEIIKKEQDRILSDASLKKSFDEITKDIDKNADLRGFKNVIETHPNWIPEIINYEEFQEKVWYGYLSNIEAKTLLDKYIKTYNENKSDLQTILEEANKEQKRWIDIINLYNSRFHVPIKVSIINQQDIILKQESAKLQFSYVETDSCIEKEKKDLDEILSKGEKRAFTILQFLFEVEARKNIGHDSILVLDDISDSFDYQNKYAIIEYLKDLAEKCNNVFYMLILTHNYDFYRTVCSRLQLDANNSWMVERTEEGELSIKSRLYRGNIYSKRFIGHDDDDKIFVSMIPFVRNLVEYTKGEKSDEYMTLTKCLHLKSDSNTVTITDIINIMKNYTQGKGMKRPESPEKVIEFILSTADGIAQEQSPDSILIENKIVLSIAIRILAEKYLYKKLIEAGKTQNQLYEVHGNQTGKWSGWYKELPQNDENSYIIERVNIMTPETIHINSFMFEPLIDMSIHHLLKLYKDCKDKLR